MNLENLRDQLNELGSLASAKLEARQALVDRLAALRAAPLTVADLAADLRDYLARVAADYPAELARTLTPYLRQPTKRIGQFGPVDLLATAPTPTHPAGVNTAALLYLFQKPLQAALAGALAGLEDLPGARPRDARAAEIAAAERELQALDRELDDLDALAAAAGISLPRRQPTPEDLEQARREERRARLLAAPLPAPEEILDWPEHVIEEESWTS